VWRAGLALGVVVIVLLAGGVWSPSVTALPAAVTVTFTPSSAVISNCETIPVEVWVNGVTGLYGADVRLAFDSTVLEVVDAYPSKPGIQVQDGDLLATDFVVSRDADNTAGTAKYVLTQINPTPPVNGSGVLFTILFRAKSPATASSLTFTRVQLADRSGGLIPSTRLNGAVTTGSPAAPPLSISRLNPTSVRLSWTAAPAVLNYRLYRASLPYGAPSDPAYRVTNSLSFDDLGALGDPVTNHYYLVESACASGYRSPPSNRTAEFEYDLVPGTP
jgi:hypothetical protein